MFARRSMGGEPPKFKADKELEELLAQRGSMDARIAQKRRALQREQGLIVDSVDALKCPKHPDVKYEVLEEIKGSGGLKVYICPDCKNDNSLEAMHNKSVAHDCPGCGGIVPGDIHSEEYSSPREAWQSLAGREGEHYHCGVCGTQLGYHYWKMS